MRRGATRRALAVGLAAALALVGVACSGGGDSDSTPTTTSPSTTEPATTTDAGGASTTDEGATTTTEPGASTTVPGDDADVLTAEEATAQLQSLLNNYRSAVIGVHDRGAVDEITQRDLSSVYSGRKVGFELGFLESLGAAGIQADPPAVSPSDVTLFDATATCAAGSAVIPEVGELFTVPLQIQQPYFFRLVPASDGASSPGWRLDLLSFTGDGARPEAATCS